MSVAAVRTNTCHVLALLTAMIALTCSFGSAHNWRTSQATLTGVIGTVCILLEGLALVCQETTTDPLEGDCIPTQAKEVSCPLAPTLIRLVAPETGPRGCWRVDYLQSACVHALQREAQRNLKYVRSLSRRLRDAPQRLSGSSWQSLPQQSLLCAAWRCSSDA